MKIDYDQASDILSMLFSSTPVAESDEVKPGVILDYDAARSVVGTNPGCQSVHGESHGGGAFRQSGLTLTEINPTLAPL